MLNKEGWQPIETAPKDGTEFIAYCECGDFWFIRWCPNDKEPASKKYKGQRGFFCAGKDVGDFVVVPCLTHWTSLPPPPSSARVRKPRKPSRVNVSRCPHDLLHPVRGRVR